MRALSKILTLAFLLICLVSAGQTKKDSLALNGKASFYHDNFQGLETSNGEYYDKDDFTAAHRTFPFNTFLLVTNKKNKKSVIVRVNDRGPFKKSRVIDLTKSAAKKINMVPFGVVPVQIEVLTYLDRVPVGDSVFSDGDTWNCHASLISMSEKTVFVWLTESWKHAFYMASSLALEYKLDSVCVHVSGSGEKRNFLVVITGIKSDDQVRDLIADLKEDGFSHARIFKPDPADSAKPRTSPLLSGQSAK
ncbi:MAG: septal ring lytic transglycosylase RlpA family protein [Bacteroidetes bacterium]|nr:septal ring lytic transglycosylase RlpA family protein [Bacteroidota bacterium]